MNIDFISGKALGIEINDDSWTLAYLGRRFASIKLYGYAILPAKKVPFSDKDEEKDFLDELEKFLLETGVATNEIVVGLPSSSVIYKTISIPAAKKRDIPSIMSFEIERHAPFPLEESYYDYHIVRQEDGMFAVMIAIVKKAVVDSCLELLGKIDVKPAAFYANAFGMLNVFNKADRLKRGKSTALISISGDNVNIHAIADNMPIATRILPVDRGGMWLKQVENTVKVLPFGMEAVPAQKGIDNIYIIRGAGVDKGVIEDVKGVLNANASIENPLADILNESMVDEDTLPQVTTAAGLALKGLGIGRIRINLLPPHYRVPEGKGGVITAFVLVGFIAVMGVSDIISIVAKERLALSDINKKLDVLKADASEAAVLKKKILGIEDKLNAIDKIKRRDTSKLDIIAELANILPQDTWVTNMEYSKGELHISGLSGSASALLPIIEGSNIFENAEFVGSITSGIEGKERFRIKMKITGVKIDAV